MEQPADAAAGPADPVAFGARLRAEGIEVPVSAVLMWVEALGTVGTQRPEDVYWAGRATLVRRPEDRPAFDTAFADFFLGVDPTDAPQDTTPAVGADPQEPEEQPRSTDSGDEGGDETDPETPEQLRWSRMEVLSHRDLAGCSPDELEELWAALATMRLRPARRRSRRRRRAGRGEIDVRRTVRAAMARGGEPVQSLHRAPTTRPRRIVLLVDVSGSMEPYARALLRFGHAAVQSGRNVEVFAFATRLTRLTRELATRDPDAALARVAASAQDISGGTRLGEALAEFNGAWGVRGTARGAEVVIVSDGWDRGDPDVLGEQMARLHRVAHRVVWVNPLKASPGYAPLAAGMAAALPHVDDFVEGHSLASLEELATLLTDAVDR